MTDERAPVGSTLTITHPTVRGIKALMFDLDDTLAPSKSPVDPSMVEALICLLQRLPVCVISGGRFEQFQSQLLQHIPGPEGILDRLHLMPTCGARYYVRQNGEVGSGLLRGPDAG
jgi:phosphomannomutase